MTKQPVRKKRAAPAPRKTRKYVRKPAEKQARAQRLAAGVSTGTAVAELARQEGLSRPHTSALVNSSPVKHIITDLINARLNIVTELFDMGLLAIREALTNGNIYATEKTKHPDGSVSAESVLIGPDHYARMGAMKVLNTICCTGRAAPKPVDPKDLIPKLTWQELERMIGEARAAKDEYDHVHAEVKP